jgi:hypothetical protein
VNSQLGSRVVLLQGGSQTLVEIRLQTLARSDGCDVRNFIFASGQDSSASRGITIV